MAANAFTGPGRKLIMAAPTFEAIGSYAHVTRAEVIKGPLDDNRVVVARTFSKIYGMAGLRLGYGIGAAETMRKMGEHRLEDSLNVFVMRCALTALDDSAGHEMARKRNAADRDEFMRQVAARKLAAIPSCGNFVMFNANRPIRSLIDHFRKNNVAIGRPFPPMDTYARISLGTPD